MSVTNFVIPDKCSVIQMVRTAKTDPFGPVNRPQLLSDAERLSPEAVITSLRAAGHAAHALNSAVEIAEFLLQNIY